MATNPLLNALTKTALAALLIGYLAGCTPAENAAPADELAPAANNEAAKQAPPAEGATESVDASKLDDLLSQDREGSRPKLMPPAESAANDDAAPATTDQPGATPGATPGEEPNR